MLMKKHLPKLIALMLACIILLAAHPSAAAGVVTPAELKAMLQRKEPVVLIDVRTPREFAEGHIPGSTSMPLDTLEGVDSLPLGGRIILYCRSGKRSEKALEILSKKGFTGIDVLEGGIEAWIASGGQVVEIPPPR